MLITKMLHHVNTTSVVIVSNQEKCILSKLIGFNIEPCTYFPNNVKEINPISLNSQFPMICILLDQFLWIQRMDNLQINSK